MSKYWSLLFLLLFWWLGLGTAVNQWITNDEPVHMLRAVTLWQTGDLRFQAGHPPLAHRLMGFFLATEPTLPTVNQLTGWEAGDRPQLGQQLLWENEAQTNLPRALFLARFPILLLGLLLGAMAMQWSHTLINKHTHLVTGAMFAFAPNALAHFTVATTDGAITFAFFGAIWAIWHGLTSTHVNKPKIWLAGLMVGLCLGAKLTGIIIVPIALFLLVLHQLRSGTPHHYKPFLQSLLIFPIAGIVLWALYGFEVRPLNGLPLPATTYLDNFLTVQQHVSSGHASFFLGERAKDGWWSYFLVTFMLKTPLVTLFLLAAGAILLWWQALQQFNIKSPLTKQTCNAITLTMPPMLLFAVATYSRLNIGYRHILPVVPFVWLISSFLFYRWFNHRLFYLLLIALAFPMLLNHPHHLSSFNQLARGQGEQYLGDSNIDWGQDFGRLQTYLKAHPQTQFSYAGVTNPTNYGLTPIALTDNFPPQFAPANPQMGSYAISINHLQGTGMQEPDLFDWFRRQEPSQQLGGSIHIYQVPHPTIGSWVAQCTDPVAPLPPEQVNQLVGQNDLRHITFDCKQSWIFPNEGASGWWVLPLHQQPPDWLEDIQLVYRHEPTATPAYAFYYWAGGLPVNGRWQTTPDLPYTWGNTATLLQFQPMADRWVTWWQVEEERPFLSVMAHGYDQTSPTPVAVADGLGFSSDQWQAGDQFLQYHLYSPNDPIVQMQTSLYDYQTGEHLTEARLLLRSRTE